MNESQNLLIRPASRTLFWYDRAAKWLREAAYGRRVSMVLIVLAVLCGIATYVVFVNPEILGASPRNAIILLNVDLILLLAFAMLIAARLVRLWSERRRGQAGSKLHINLVFLFSLLTVMPAIVVTILSGIFFNVGVNGWFSDRVRTALTESTQVAQAYFSEHQKVISESVEGMAQVLSQQMGDLQQNPDFFNHALDVNAQMRGLSEAIVFDVSQVVLARSQLSFSLQFERISVEALEQSSHHVVILSSSSGDRVRALRRIPDTDAYLLVGRFVDTKVLNRIDQVRNAVSEYNVIESKLGKLGMMFVQIFLVTCLLLLLIAVWVGLTFATRLAKPIQSLIEASEKVSEGDWSVQVPEGPINDELSGLLKAFNRMTQKLQSQKTELVKANRQNELRRQLIEDVLSGVTAGVVSTTISGKVRFFNRSAQDIMGQVGILSAGKSLRKVFPELGDLLERFKESKEHLLQSQVIFTRDDVSHTLLVRIVGEHQQGYIVTFNDVTDLVGAQKKAAWADVARHIAHEIKNPLTPIQLSAERLQRKYLKEITSSPENFQTCIATIIRQVEHIGRLVSEFSSFARMPAPKMVPEDLITLGRQIIFLHQTSLQDVSFVFDCSYEKLEMVCDGNQISQVLTNLILNAAGAIEARLKKNIRTNEISVIKISFTCAEETFKITVEDNGEGFPEQDRELLLDPYITHRPTGTGLGLSIVRKIVGDHGGTVGLGDAVGGGARVQLSFPRSILRTCKEKKEKGARVKNGP